MSEPSLDGEDDGGCLQRLSGNVHKGMEWFFGRLTEIVVGYPMSTIGISVAFFVVMGNGVWFYEDDLGNQQFTPSNSRAVKDEDWVVERFGYDTRVVLPYFVGDTLLTKASLLFMQDYFEWMTSHHLVVDGVNVTYDVACSRYSSSDPCKEPVSILSYWRHNKTLLEADPDPLHTINTVPWRDVVPSGPDVEHYMSNVKRGDGGDIVAVDAVRMIVLIKNEKVETGEGLDDEESKQFEIILSERTEDRRNDDVSTHGVAVYCYTLGWHTKASEESIQAGVAGLVMGYIAMIFYAMMVLSRSRLKYSHAALGLASVMSVGMSTFAAYGFCWYLGIKFNTVVQVLILVLLGVGIDDTFVIMDSWWDCAHEVDMQKRMVLALRHAGPAITITSMTDLVAFLAGSVTDFPALRDFCYYAAVGICFDFIFQCTFLVAMVYLDSVRQQKSRSDILCCLTVEPDTGICVKKDDPTWLESDRGLQNLVIGTWLPKIILSPVGKCVVIVMSMVFLGVGLWGCLEELKMNYNNEWPVASTHALQDTFTVRKRYFAGETTLANAYFRDIDYPNNQSLLTRGVDILESSRWVVPQSASCWLVDFQQYIAETYPANVTENGEINPMVFYPRLRQWASTETGPEESWVHIDNIRWEGDVLIASRCGFAIIEAAQGDGETAVNAMHGLRDSLAEVGAFPWGGEFIYWESYARMIPEAVRNVGIAASCVFVLVTILIANIQIGLLVVLAIGCVDVCMLGFMPILDVDLNGISIVCIVLAIGLAVDYSVHIANAFLHVKSENRTHRAAYAIWKMGPAVMNGGTSTFLAVLPAGFADSYVFKAFFRMFLLIILFGLWFGVFLLPVVLSFIGPAAYAHSPLLSDHPEWNPLDPDHDVRPSDGNTQGTQEPDHIPEETPKEV